MADSLLFKLDGHKVVPVTNVWEWAEWMDAGELSVDHTTHHGIRVSTVFLGLPAPRSSVGPHLLFETALMKDTELLTVAERYSTWDEAERGHAKWAKALKEKRTPFTL